MEPSITEWLPWLLQTTDPLFPTGAYAHSLGLEEVVRLGVVTDEKTLTGFLREQVVPALERLDLPYVRFAWEAAKGADVDALCEADAELDAWKICREQREASAALGSRRLLMLLKLGSEPVLEAYAARSTGRHHAVVCGLQGTTMPLDAVLTGYFYQSMSGACGAALKLIRIGQDGCQRVLQGALAEGPVVVARSKAVARDEVGVFNPLLEIAGMRHETAFERLFIS
jgi:urease accessory protein